MLIIFAGLPGVGKSETARELARRLGAAYLRIDSIEHALRDSGVTTGELDDSGYRIAYALAEDNLRLGRTVVADCVNPLAITRNSWLDCARSAAVRALEIEVQCSDSDEHRRRVEARTSEIPGLILPSWEDVVTRHYEPWTREHLVLDSATATVEQNVEQIQKMLHDHYQMAVRRT